jgi:hypothetical protein
VEPQFGPHLQSVPQQQWVLEFPATAWPKLHDAVEIAKQGAETVSETDRAAATVARNRRDAVLITLLVYVTLCWPANGEIARRRDEIGFLDYIGTQFRRRVFKGYLPTRNLIEWFAPTAFIRATNRIIVSGVPRVSK